MFSKFKLSNFDSSGFYSYNTYGEGLINKYEIELKSDLSAFINIDGTIDGSKLQENWFNTTTKYDIFLSHSHKDRDLAISIAGFLKKEMQLNTFIDSCLWGYSNDLLKKIDDDYCRHSNGTSYDYDKRNYSTSHVHMMLSIALSNMIDKCESVFFLNTPNSISMKENIRNEQTMSPWIFHELSIANIIRQNPIERYSILKHAEERALFENAAHLQITYDVEKLLSTFLPLSTNELMKSADDWKINAKHLSNAMDYLYISKGIIELQ